MIRFPEGKGTRLETRVGRRKRGRGERAWGQREEGEKRRGRRKKRRKKKVKWEVLFCLASGIQSLAALWLWVSCLLP